MRKTIQNNANNNFLSPQLQSKTNKQEFVTCTLEDRTD